MKGKKVALAAMAAAVFMTPGQPVSAGRRAMVFVSSKTELTPKQRKARNAARAARKARRKNRRQ